LSSYALEEFLKKDNDKFHRYDKACGQAIHPLLCIIPGRKGNESQLDHVIAHLQSEKGMNRSLTTLSFSC